MSERKHISTLKATYDIMKIHDRNLKMINNQKLRRIEDLISNKRKLRFSSIDQTDSLLELTSERNLLPGTNIANSENSPYQTSQGGSNPSNSSLAGQTNSVSQRFSSVSGLNSDSASTSETEIEKLKQESAICGEGNNKIGGQREDLARAIRMVIEGSEKDDYLLMNGLNIIQKNLKSSSPPYYSVIKDDEFLETISGLIERKNSVIQIAVLWILVLLVNGPTPVTERVAKECNIKGVINLLYSDDPDVSNLAAWVVGNVAGDNNDMRDLMISLNVIDHVWVILGQFVRVTKMLAEQGPTVLNPLTGNQASPDSITTPEYQNSRREDPAFLSPTPFDATDEFCLDNSGTTAATSENNWDSGKEILFSPFKPTASSGSSTKDGDKCGKAMKMCTSGSGSESDGDLERFEDVDGSSETEMNTVDKLHKKGKRDKPERRHMVAGSINISEYRRALPFIRSLTWSVINLSRGKPRAKFSTIKPLVPVLAEALLVCDDEEVISNILTIVSYIADGGDDPIKDLMLHGIHITVLDFINRNAVTCEMIQPGAHSAHASDEAEDSNNVVEDTDRLRRGTKSKNMIFLCSRKALGNMLSGSDIQTTELIKQGLFGALKKVLRCDNNEVIVDGLWILSNVAAGSKTHIELLCSSGLTQVVVGFLNSENKAIRKEASYVINYIAVSNVYKACSMLISDGVVEGICMFLARVALGGTDSIDTVMRVVKPISNLYYHGEVCRDTGPNTVQDKFLQLGVLAHLEALHQKRNAKLTKMVSEVEATLRNEKTEEGDVYCGAEESDGYFAGDSYSYETEEEHKE